MNSENNNLKLATLFNFIYTVIGFLLVISFLIILMMFVNSTNGLGLDPSIGLGWRFTPNELDGLSERFAIAKFGYDTVQADSSLINTCKVEILQNYTLTNGTYIFNGTNLPPWQTLFLAGFGLLFIILGLINGFRFLKAKSEELTVLAVINIFDLNIISGIFIFRYIKDLKENR